jgi:hypothetical protein
MEILVNGSPTKEFTVGEKVETMRPFITLFILDSGKGSYEINAKGS